MEISIDNGTYVRKEVVGCDEAGKGLIFNSFKITSITSKNVIIFGLIASGCLTSRKINLIDFEKFIEKYNTYR